MNNYVDNPYVGIILEGAGNFRRWDLDEEVGHSEGVLGTISSLAPSFLLSLLPANMGQAASTTGPQHNDAAVSQAQSHESGHTWIKVLEMRSQQKQIFLSLSHFW